MIWLDVECEDCGALLSFGFELNCEVEYVHGVRDGPPWVDQCVTCDQYLERFGKVIKSEVIE